MKPETERALKAYFEHARRELFPKIESSAMTLCIVDKARDAKLAMELGASLLLNKPILIFILKGVKVSPKLRMIADEYIEYDRFDDPITQAKLQAALLRLTQKVKPRG